MRFDRMGIWAFLVSVAYVPSVMSAAVAGRWAVIALGVPLVAEIRLKVAPIVQMALVMGITWACTSLLLAPDFLDGSLQLYFMLLLIGAMGAASQQDSLDSAMIGMCLGIGVSVLVSVPTWFGHTLLPQASNAYAGLFFNSEVFTELAAPLAVWAIVKRRWWLAILPIVPVLANLSRISVFSVIFALVVAFWPKAWKWRAAILVAAAILSVGAVIYLTFMHEKLASAALRVTIWLSTIFAIDPLGHGIGWYRASHTTEEFAHSDVLQALAELGLGALCFAAIPIQALHNRWDHAERAAFIVVCIELVFSFPLHVPAGAFLAALLAGFLVRDRAGFRIVRLDSGSEDGEHNEWHTAIRGDLDPGGERGSFVFPLRYSLARVSRLGTERSCEAGG
jgi:hypothetical protein